MVGVRETLIALSSGDIKLGAGGAKTVVVKLNVVEYGPDPPGFLALTRQKYCVLFSNGPTLRDVVVSMESSTTIPVVNPEFVAT